jgi:hypothetical protein
VLLRQEYGEVSQELLQRGVAQLNLNLAFREGAAAISAGAFFLFLVAPPSRRLSWGRLARTCEAKMASRQPAGRRRYNDDSSPARTGRAHTAPSVKFSASTPKA